MENTIYVCGSGECDQLGVPDVFLCKRPRSISLPSSISTVSCGAMHTLALSSSGAVFSWGCNDEGALGREGPESFPLQVPSLQQITQISAGDSHSAALAGPVHSLYCWGTYRNRSGVMATGSRTAIEIGKFELRKINEMTQILSGANHTLLLADKKVFAWGDSDDGQIGRLPHSRQQVKHSLQIEGLGLKGISMIFTGSYHSFAVDAKGKVFGWGLNNYGQLGDGTCESTFRPHELRAVTACCFIELSGGENHSLGLTVGGEMYSWGRNDDFQLGTNDSEHRAMPVLLSSPSNVRSIECGGHFNLCVTHNDNIYSWGLGDCFVLLNGKERALSMPCLVSWSTNKAVSQLRAGAQHVVLLSQPAALSFEPCGLKRKLASSSSPAKRLKK